MTLLELKEKEHEYLGYDEGKGYIYSVRVNLDTYKVVAVKDGEVNTLIQFKGEVK